MSFSLSKINATKIFNENVVVKKSLGIAILVDSKISNNEKIENSLKKYEIIVWGKAKTSMHLFFKLYSK